MKNQQKILGHYCTSKDYFPHFNFRNYPSFTPCKIEIICVAKLVRQIFVTSILLQLCQAGEKGSKSLNKGGKDLSENSAKF